MRPALRALAAAALATVTLALAAPSSYAAPVRSSCSGGGPTVTDPWAQTYATVYCPTWTAADMTYGPYTSPAHLVVTGRMYAGTNWVVCQSVGRENPALGGGHNRYWIYTQGDVAYRDRGWGWLPATAFSYGGDYEPIPGVPICNA